MPRRTHLKSLALLVGLASGMSGCATQVAPTHPTGRNLTECQRILNALPSRLDGRDRAATKGSDFAVAWGDPPVVLRCGVAKPKNFDETLGCQGVNGIDWFVASSTIDDPESDVLMTSIARSTNVEVRVPAKLRPPADEMVDIGRVLASTTTKIGECG